MSVLGAVGGIRHLPGGGGAGVDVPEHFDERARNRIRIVAEREPERRQRGGDRRQALLVERLAPRMAEERSGSGRSSGVEVFTL
jgi:hypothetical protein